MGHIAQELIEQLSSEELKAQLDQQHDLVKKLSFLKLQQTAETVAHMQKGIAAMKPKPSQQTVISNPGKSDYPLYFIHSHKKSTIFNFNK